MSKGIVIVDFSGTLVKPEVAEAANSKRFQLLNIPLPDKNEHKEHHASKAHYTIIKDHINSMFGIEDDMNIGYVQNYGERISLTGKDVKTMMMTDLFRNSMYLVAKEQGLNVFSEGMIPALKKIREQGYQLAIVSGIRTDIITGMLAICTCPLSFDFVFGQDPVLSRDNNDQQMTELSQLGKITHIIGDKLSDIEPAKKLDAISIFFRGGHPTGGEEEFADYSIDNPEELLKIIQ